MSTFIDYFVNIAASAWAALSAVISDQYGVYIAFIFIFAAIVVILAFLMSLFPLLFRSISAFFRRF